ncbi:DNA-binding transcriptional regulator, XRE-family HTH domain [Nitrosospira sp. Nsp14]|uniref:helix-turn-helix transcriptional regulator n=1 Tax=Nitrosospira sp. Nsp14 TaxID=1855333 RepID=UPI0008E1AEBA|nr:helix-turn-helix transcriptional regulator [Nitrosospira sp. Nsp14]SFH60345.1 DNA-binding transcriptional regulator, XRE-family HTH domain [Nitrosospira sp. Nsp14]
MDIAKIIREGREKLNLNQSQLAELVGVSPQAVQQWESGATQPRGKRLNKIAQVLKLSQALMHFGASSEPSDEGAIARVGASGRENAVAAVVAGAGAAPSRSDDNDPLISQVIEAMRRMSKEDAARLVTISKALVGENVAEEKRAAAEAGLKPLPVPDMAAHPAPAFPPRRMPESRSKTRGKTAVR